MDVKVYWFLFFWKRKINSLKSITLTTGAGLESVWTFHKLHYRGYFMEEEESKYINKTLSELTIKFEEKFDELSKSIGKTVGEKQEYAEGEINKNPLAYMAGAFVGGVIVGYVLGWGK